MARPEDILNAVTIEDIIQQAMREMFMGRGRKSRIAQETSLRKAIHVATERKQKSIEVLTHTLSYFAAKLQRAEDDLRTLTGRIYPSENEVASGVKESAEV